MDDEIHNQDTIRPETEGTRTTSSLPRGTNLGRFVVLEEIGSGGMGVVYAAYDSVLDRKVALKLLHADAEGEAAAVRQDRLMREARAMAKLAHPNVNTVFEVGTYRGQVFVAMELVEGYTLSGWLQEKTRSTKDILEIFRQAGRGLAAAHRAGLVHRDIKPDNLLIGEDGRVRVTDFGLVASRDAGREPEAPDAGPQAEEEGEIASLTRTGAVMGSPAYMSPEQHGGETVSAKSDQFSFCVALFEALYGKRPFSGDSGEQLAANVIEGRLEPLAKGGSVAAWVRQVVLRGLKTDPAERFPTMDDLLAALGKDPARKRRVAAAWAAIVIALAAGGWGMYKEFSSDASAACGAMERHLEGVWAGERQRAVLSAFSGTARPYAEQTFEKVKSRLDDYAGRWVAMRTKSCRATHLRQEQSDTVFELRRQCLDRRLSELDALVKLFTEKSDPGVLDRAVEATYELTPLSVCSDVEFLQARIPLPENPAVRTKVQDLYDRIDGLRALERVGKHKDILGQAKKIATAARGLEYPAFRAEALWLLGGLQARTSEIEAAEETLYEAGQAAARARDDRLRARILTRLIYVIGNLQDRRQAALALEPAARMVIARAGGGDLLRAKLMSSVGVVYDSDGKYDEALEQHRKALQLYEEELGELHPRVARSHTHIGVVLKEQGKYDEAIEHYLKAHAIREKILDPRHPDIGNALNNLGVVYDEKGEDEKAIGYYRRALQIWTAALGTDNPRVAMATNNIGSYYHEHGQYGEALDFYRQSLDIRIRLLGKKHQYTLRVRENIAITHEAMGKFDQAFDEFREILALNEEVLGPEHPGVAFSSNRLGNCFLKRGEHDRALVAYRRALSIYEKAHGPHHISLAEPLNNLGRVFAEIRKLKQARTHVERALEIVTDTFDENHAGAAEVLVTLAMIARLEGKPKEALGHLEKAMPILKEELGENNPLLAAARAELLEVKKALPKRDRRRL